MVEKPTKMKRGTTIKKATHTTPKTRKKALSKTIKKATNFVQHCKDIHTPSILKAKARTTNPTKNLAAEFNIIKKQLAKHI